MEKAEILEHTVLFLQKSRDTKRREAAAGTQKDCFREGFSACLERAARFLGPEGKGLGLRAALHPSTSAHSPSSHSASADRRDGGEARPSSSSQLLRSSCSSLLHLWLPVPGSVPGLVVFRYIQTTGRSQRPPLSQQVSNGAHKQNLLQSQAASHPLWRPWP